MESDRAYFMRRAAQEQSAATKSDGKARDAHLELAERYQALSRPEESAEEPPLADSPHAEAPSA